MENLVELNQLEQELIEGGLSAYEVGYGLGTLVKKIGTLAGFFALFLL